MTTNEIITAVKALKVGDEVAVNGYTVVKYGRNNYHVYVGRAYASPTRWGSLRDAYTVAVKIGQAQ
jgi:hypothetical protein